MSNDLKDILFNSNKDIDNQQIMDYLSHHLQPEQQHEIEKDMVDDPFINDAVEGLQKVDNQAALQSYVDQLNTSLHNQIAKSKKRTHKRRWKDDSQTYVAVIIILVLLALSFVLIKKFLDSKNGKPGASIELHSVPHVDKNTGTQ